MVSLHMVFQRKCRSPDFIRKWFLSSVYSYMAFRSGIHRKCWSQENGFSPLCVHMCLFKWKMKMMTHRIYKNMVFSSVSSGVFCNAEPHMSQENGFPPAYSHVTFQSGSQRKYCSTNFMIKWFPSSVCFCVSPVLIFQKILIWRFHNGFSLMCFSLRLSNFYFIENPDLQISTNNGSFSVCVFIFDILICIVENIEKLFM